MNNGEKNDMFDKLRDAAIESRQAKNERTFREWLNNICRQLEMPKNPVKE